MPKVIQVIESQTKEGAGTKDNRYRKVTQYHTLEGTFLAEDDPCSVIERDFSVYEESKKEIEKLEKLIEVGKRAAATLRGIMKSGEAWYNNRGEKIVAKETLKACEDAGLLKEESVNAS